MVSALRGAARRTRCHLESSAVWPKEASRLDSRVTEPGAAAGTRLLIGPQIVVSSPPGGVAMTDSEADLPLGGRRGKQRTCLGAGLHGRKEGRKEWKIRVCRRVRRGRGSGRGKRMGRLGGQCTGLRADMQSNAMLPPLPPSRPFPLPLPSHTHLRSAQGACLHRRVEGGQHRRDLLLLLLLL